MTAAAERLIDRSVWWHCFDFCRNVLFPLAGFSLMISFVLSGQYSSFDIVLFVFFFLATGIGITVGWHRLFAHRAFKAKPWLRMTLAVLGTFAWQRPLFVWIVRHRLHHAHPDKKGDFHSPYVRYDGTKIKGKFNQFLHAHYQWLHLYDPIVDPHSSLIKDLYSDRGLRWIDENYNGLALVSIILPGVLGGVFYGNLDGFIRGVVWGGLGRIFVSLQVIWLISSVAHFVGKKTYYAGDESTNTHILGWLVLGEGYHNNHHAFPSSPCFGFDKAQFDLGWLFIKCMWKLGQIYDLKSVPDAKRRTFRKLLKKTSDGHEYRYGISREGDMLTQ